MTITVTLVRGVDSSPWTVPAGVTSVSAFVQGGGGGGGGNSLSTDGGSGGGGGASATRVFATSPGATFAFSMGAGGTAGAATADAVAGTGGTTWFSSNDSAGCVAVGGAGGKAPSAAGVPYAGGLGGAAASGFGDTKFSGGKGEAGLNSNNGRGGYGGSSGGSAANGVSGPDTYSTNVYPGGTPTNGAAGGNGGTTGAGTVGAVGGGGGGGQGDSAGVGQVGGDGRIILTYTPVQKVTPPSATFTFSMKVPLAYQLAPNKVQPPSAALSFGMQQPTITQTTPSVYNVFMHSRVNTQLRPNSSSTSSSFVFPPKATWTFSLQVPLVKQISSTLVQVLGRDFHIDEQVPQVEVVSTFIRPTQEVLVYQVRNPLIRQYNPALDTYVRPSKVDFVFSMKVPKASTGQYIKPSATALTMTTKVPIIRQPASGAEQRIQPSAAAFTFGMKVPLVSTTSAVRPGYATFVYSMKAPIVRQPGAIQPNSVTWPFGTLAPIITRTGKITPPSIEFALLPQDPIIIQSGGATVTSGPTGIHKQFKPNKARNLMVFLTDAGQNVTVQISKDGAAFANIAPVVLDRTGGWYCLQLLPEDFDTVGDLIIIAKTATASSTIFGEVEESTLDEMVEASFSLRQSMRLANSANAGITNSFAPNAGVGHLRDLNDTKDRITAVVDTFGNRIAVSYDLSD